ncbi:hypothetical protein [Leifsonia poae]|uniref:hypothetical protein n=1 Tax=Leifsonia poae TaxID=110933 RepID=UPI001CC09AB6|nr:hypothetical protein [Leifsonia poae]
MDITRAHNDRMRDLDPLIGPLAPLDPTAAGYRVARVGAAGAEAIARLEAVEADSLDAVWGALRRHSLDLRSAGEDGERTVAVERVLDAWLAEITDAERRGDRDSSARVAVPSRDIALVNALYGRGFGPTGIRALRPRPRSHQGAAPGLPRTLQGGVVRTATVDDAEVLGRLDEKLLALDAHFAGVTVRPKAASMFADAYRDRLRRAPDTTWVLERGGTITGFIHVMPDEASPEPDSPPLALVGGQYLVVMYLDESERGAGMGAEFVGIAHDILDATASPYTLLSYAVANPRSGPFWSRSGYRPVITEWQRRPAVL